MVSRPDPEMDTAGEALLVRVFAHGIDLTAAGFVGGLVWVVGGLLRGAVDGGLALVGGGSGSVSIVGGAIWAVTWAVVFAAVAGYFALGYTVAGQTLGQRMTDLVVATPDGDHPGTGAALLRGAVRAAPVPLVAVLALLFGLGGVVAGAFVFLGWAALELAVVAASGDGRGIADRVAGTVVAKEALAV